MARIQQNDYGTVIWLSARDTYEWAHRAGAAWPCSTLANRRLVASFDHRGDLVDLSIDSGRGDQDCDAHEFNAIIADHLPKGHPAAR